MLPKTCQPNNGTIPTNKRFSGPWSITKTGTIYNSQHHEINGWKNNAIAHCRDAWEHIDPKTTTTFLFSPADLYPDSMTRKNHIGNIQRNFTDYSIMIRNKPNLIPSNTTHKHYFGKTNLLEETDDSYQTLNINSASIYTNQIKRFGLMRLIECTYDWHFNLVDPENPPSNKKLVDIFNYTRFNITTATGISVLSGAVSSYKESNQSNHFPGDTIKCSASPTTAMPVGSYVYDNVGNFLGIVNAVGTITDADGATTHTNSIRLTPTAYEGKASYGTIYRPEGNYYTGELYVISETQMGGSAGSNNQSYYHYQVTGRGGKSTFIKTHNKSNKRTPLKLNMLQSAIFNGYSGDTSTSAYKNCGYGQSNSSTSEWYKHYESQMDMAYSNSYEVGRLNHIAIPPLFEGFEIHPIAKGTSSASDTNVKIREIDLSPTVFTVKGAHTVNGSVETDASSPQYGTGSTGVIQFNEAATSTVSYAPGDKFYTENGEFIGEMSAHTFNYKSSGDGAIWLKDDVKLAIDLSDGMKIFRATGVTDESSYTGGNDYIARTNINRSGYHPLAAKNHVATDSTLHTGGIPTNEYLHPSKVMKAIGDCVPVVMNGSHKSELTGADLPVSPYMYLRAVALSRFNIEHQRDLGKIDVGASLKIANITDSSEPGIDRKMGNQHTIWDGSSPYGGDDYADNTTDRYKVTQYFISLGKAISAYGGNDENNQVLTNEVFSRWLITEGDGSSSGKILNNGGAADAGRNIADGANIVFKPTLNIADADKRYAYTSSNGQSDLTLLQFDTNASTKTKWLEFVPNLTGCYLVSTTSKDFKYGGTNASNMFEHSIENHIPKTIHYVVSHTIRRDSSPASDEFYSYHHILIDNCSSSSELENHYRIMRPAHVCLWSESPQEIDLYKMSSRYTKRPDSNEMYKDIGLSQYYEDGEYLKGDEDEADYNEAVQSMYVPINSDHTSTTRRFLVPRNSNYSHSSGNLFGFNDTFANGNTYNVFMNDGINKQRNSISIQGGQETTLVFNNKFNNKLSGVVSIGETFTINCKEKIILNNPETASIGTSVKICSDSDDIISDLMTDNNLKFNNTELNYPYYVGPDIKGADLFNATNYLAKYKNKEILFNDDTVEFITTNNILRFTDIELNYDNSDIKVSSVSRADSAFDFYNEIIVYGKRDKVIKRDSKSIREIGKKTLEEYNEELITQSEVDKRARTLLDMHTANETRLTIKLHDKGIETLKVGDIITMEFTRDHIPRDSYLVLQIHQGTSGFLELEVGKYRKGLENRLAELIVENKKITGVLRGSKFKTPIIQEGLYDTLKLKPIKLLGYKIEATGTQMGFNTYMAVDSLLGFGTTTTTKIIDEDLL